MLAPVQDRIEKVLYIFIFYVSLLLLLWFLLFDSINIWSLWYLLKSPRSFVVIWRIQDHFLHQILDRTLRVWRRRNSYCLTSLTAIFWALKTKFVNASMFPFFNVIYAKVVSFAWKAKINCLETWWRISSFFYLSCFWIRSTSRMYSETRMGIGRSIISICGKKLWKFHNIVSLISFSLTVFSWALSRTLNSTCILWKIPLNFNDLLLIIFIYLCRVESKFLWGELYLILLLNLLSSK